MWTSSSLHMQTRQHHPLGVSWLWSFTCHASNSELEGFGSVPESPAQTWGRSQWHSRMPLAGLVASGDTSPCTQKHKHTQLLSAWPGSSRLPPPSQGGPSVWLVQVFFWLQPAGEMCHFLGWGSWGAAGQQCPAPGSQPGRSTQALLGRAAQTLHCFESKFPNPAKLFNRALLWSTGIPPWWGICSLYIYTCVYLCVTVYIHLCTNMCVHIYVCVSSLGRCSKKIFHLMK